MTAKGTWTKETWGEMSMKYGVYIALLLLFAVNSVVTPNFFRLNTVWNIFIQSATTLLCSLGMTIVISGGGINLATGSTMALCSCITARTLQLTDSIPLAFVLVIATALFTGFLLGGIVGVFNVQPMIATLAASTILRGFAYLFPRMGIIPVSNRAFRNFAVYRFFGVVPIQILIVAVTVFLVWLLLRKMSFGRYVEAIGDNRSASLFSGIRINSVTILMYMFSSFLAGMAGMLETSRIAASDAQTIGVTMEMDAVASTVIGGTPLSGGRPRVVGTMVGVFIMQLITITVNMNNIPYEYSLIIKALIILVAIFIQTADRKK